MNILVLCCRMSGIAGFNQRETVKDMVLADYQVPKGVSLYKSLRIQKQTFKKMLILKNIKPYAFSSQYVACFLFSQASTVVSFLLLTKGLQYLMLVIPKSVKGSLVFAL